MLHAFLHQPRKLALRAALLFAWTTGAAFAAQANPWSASDADGAAMPSPGNSLLNDLNTGNLSATPVGFEENKGQVVTTAGMPAPDVLFRLSEGNTSIFLLRGGIAYQFNRLHRPEGMDALEEEARKDPAKQHQLEAMRKQVRLETFRMDMLLEGADLNARITTEGRSADYTQYYNHDALDVHTYNKVTFHEVYPGIDWVIYTTEKGFKYDFVLRPGADPAQIRLRFKDHEELRVEADGSLVHGNQMGRFTEARPVSFQNGREVGTRFVLEDYPDGSGQALLRFDLDAYDAEQPLTIDPARLWGTYYGGTGSEDGNSCAVDGNGNIFLAGFTRSPNAIAAGGHQNSFGGSTDAFLVKFNAGGTRLWGTYYGGTGTEYGESCAVDGSGNVFLAGTTYSSTSIASGGHQNGFGGNSDAFLVKFNGSGTRLWGTYYGGSNSDAGFSCAVDGSGNVFLSGTAESTSAISSGGHQNSLGGINDAFLVKFNAGGTRLWGTYYGGAFSELGWSCALDGSGNVFLAGYAGASTAIAFGGHQDINGGGFDAFLVKFDGNGTRIWGTYYGGSSSDYGESCAVDGSGNVFLAGYTESTTAIASGGHQNSIDLTSDKPDAFLVKFDAGGTRLWGTYYGNAAEDQGYSCAVDGSGNVFLAGWTRSKFAIASGGHQNSNGGGSDAFLVKFNAGGTRLWGSYYGGMGREYGESCAVDGSGNVFLAGTTYSNNAIAFNGHQNSRGGETEDAFLVKFEGGGTPNPGCTEETLVISLTLDNFGNQTTWELRTASNTVVATGGPYSNGTLGTVVTDTLCVSEGCYHIGVHDANGDGMGQGGYVLSDGNGNRIIDADGAFDALSYIGAKFCLPMGPVEQLPTTCDRTDLTLNDQLVTTTLPGADAYQFWFFDPHGSYSQTFMRATNMIGPAPNADFPHNLMLNVRVRANVAGAWTPYGPACVLMVTDAPGMQPTSVAELQDLRGAFTAWPNPNNGYRLHISLTGLDAEVRTADITLYDATGRQVLSTTLPVDQGAVGTVLDLGNTVSGVYLVRVNAGGTLHESRILVVND